MNAMAGASCSRRSWLPAALAAALTGVASADQRPADELPGLTEATLARMTHLSLDQPAAVQGAAASPPPAIAPEFRKDTWCWQAYGSAVFGDPAKGAQYSGHWGFGYYFEDYQSVNLDFFGSYIDSGIDDNGAAIGVDLVYRGHFHRSADEALTFFFEAGAGLQQQSTKFAGKRHFNFRLTIGFGTTLQLDEHARLIMGARYIHISDAGIKGGGGGFDGPNLYAGIMVPF